MDFDGKSIRLEAIRAEEDYAGVRANLIAGCGRARLGLQIDLGQADSVWPPPESHRYPSLLDLPEPEILAYPREALVAEKLEALVVLGDRNSRIKDFFDLHYLAATCRFDRGTLVEAVRRTFDRRSTPYPSDTPIGLTRAYWENPSRPAQTRAFARRARIDPPEKPGETFSPLLEAFLLPALEDFRRDRAKEGSWEPGGPWR
ncbi:MAG: hypothetical protein GF346_01930 [Candidatus Eisenbacteria bacterium]|nr:hypothetical protein [Candidatus Latescibacterota bacterium]MBD3301190.1 hypothetical protein [Candidatus Eisenbacteria bacterium]